MYPSVYMTYLSPSVCLYMCITRPICLYMYNLCPSICVHVCTVHMGAYIHMCTILSTCLSVCLYLSLCQSVRLSLRGHPGPLHRVHVTLMPGTPLNDGTSVEFGARPPPRDVWLCTPFPPSALVLVSPLVPFSPPSCIVLTQRTPACSRRGGLPSGNSTSLGGASSRFLGGWCACGCAPSIRPVGAVEQRPASCRCVDTLVHDTAEARPDVCV